MEDILDTSDSEKYYFEYNSEVERESYDFAFQYEGIFKNGLADGAGKCIIKAYDDEKNKPSISKCDFNKGVLSSTVTLPNGLVIGPVKEVLQKEREKKALIKSDFK